MWKQIIGAALGAATGATAPTPSVFDYKKEGVDFLTGYGPERKKAFAPTLATMLDKANGKKLGLSGAERARAAAAEIARLRGNVDTMHEGINERAIASGNGPASGMTEASHLQAGIAGLNAERGLLGQIAAGDISRRLDRQTEAMGMVTDLYGRENKQENSAIGAQWQTEEEKRMAGSDLHRGIAGASVGWSGKRRA